MVLKQFDFMFNKLENPKYPLLGPNIKGLLIIGMWKSKNMSGIVYTNVMIVFGIVMFILNQIEVFFLMKEDFMSGLIELSILILGFVGHYKFVCFIIWQREWKQLFMNISCREKMQQKENDPILITEIKAYTKYARFITYGYWCLSAITSILVILTPFLKYLTSDDKDLNNMRKYHVIKTWYPFNTNTNILGFSIATILESIRIIGGAGILGTFDSAAVSVMIFFSGQMNILRNNCSRIFKSNAVIPRHVVLKRIKTIHEHHNFLIENFALFNSILSPIMFIYVFNCSITICCSLIQLKAGQLSMSEKLWVIEFIVALSAQLFFYCWHGNEVIIASLKVEKGIYESDYWKGDSYVRKHLILLAGKLSQDCILMAGPFNTLRISMFIDILKASYSFYTFFDTIQE